jgi:hypothetical protein
MHFLDKSDAIPGTNAKVLGFSGGKHDTQSDKEAVVYFST